MEVITNDTTPCIPLISPAEKKLLDMLAAAYVDFLFSIPDTDTVNSPYQTAAANEESYRLHSDQ